VRVVAFDVGARRTGVAVSDPTATLARPQGCLTGGDRVADAVALVRELQAEDAEERPSAPRDVIVVVGLPRRLDGSDTDATARAREFARALERRLGTPVVFQDERLSSVEAESRLAVGERDWRRRKAKLDAAAAAVILQDYLDTRARANGAARPFDNDPVAADAHD
jgi:putative Holliday junction resolvase